MAAFKCRCRKNSDVLKSAQHTRGIHHTQSHTHTHPGNNTHFSSTAVTPSRFSACEFHSRSLRENLKTERAKMEKVMEGNAMRDNVSCTKEPNKYVWHPVLNGLPVIVAVCLRWVERLERFNLLTDSDCVPEETIIYDANVIHPCSGRNACISLLTR